MKQEKVRKGIYNTCPTKNFYPRCMKNYKSIRKSQTTQFKNGQRLQQAFYKQWYSNGQQTNEKVNESPLLTREIQIKITLRYHSTTSRMAKKLTMQGWQARGKTGTLISCQWDCKSVWLLW